MSSDQDSNITPIPNSPTNGQTDQQANDIGQTHSRSEIENALKGQTVRKKDSSANSPLAHSLPVKPRRQQVLGGDLSGISKKAHHGLLGRYGKPSVFNWIAAIIVLLTLVAFFWPQSSDKTTQEITQRLEQNRPPSIYTESRVDEPPQQSSSFGRIDDAERAGKFRERDARDREVRELLANASELLKKGSYTLPPEGNALAAYNKVLGYEPNNSSAKQGIDYINNRFLDTGKQALNQNKLSLANNALSKLAKINIESEQHQELVDAIDQWQQTQKLNKLIEQGLNALSRKRFVAPQNNNALSFFKQALSLQAGHPPAISGIKQINNILSKLIDNAIEEKDFPNADELLTNLVIVNKTLQANTSTPEAKITQGDIQLSPLEALQARLAEARAEDAIEKQVQEQLANSNLTISNDKTPEQEATEQALFDQQYLTRGLQAYTDGDYPTALALLQPLADKGISRAQIRLAYMHYLGRGTERNRSEASRIAKQSLPAIRKFADEGRTWAQTDLGNLYEDGLGLSRNYSNAIKWYRLAAEAGYPRAQTNLGIMYARGRGITANRRTAIQWFQRAAKQGNSVAQRNLEALGVR